MTYRDPGDEPKGKRSRVRMVMIEGSGPKVGDLFSAALEAMDERVTTHGGDNLALTGEQRKEHELELHDDRKKEAIVWLRKQLAKLYQQRVQEGTIKMREQGYIVLGVDEGGPFVTADDARRIYDGSRFPKEYSENHTFFGSIFRGNDWKPTGQRVPSLHPANNARSIMCWRYVGE
jgi:hypothetical protein